MKNIKRGQLGVNYVETVVNKCGCNFTKTEQEDDIGIDGYIEICKDNKSLLVAVQIKCGEYYYKSKSEYCKLPIGKHYEYWKNYKLPVYGIICNPELTNAYFINIKLFLEDDNKDQKYIKFEKNEFLKFDDQHFTNYFYNTVNGNFPLLKLSDALFYSNSEVYYERKIAFCNLSNRYVTEKKSWEKFLELFKSKTIDMDSLIYTFSRIFHNPDSYSVSLTPQDQTYVENCLNKILNEDEIIKLLSYINEEDGIARGTIGQCVEVILNSLNKSEILLKIINDSSLDGNIRENAASIFAYKNPKLYLKLYSDHTIVKTEFNDMIFDYINKNGGFYLY